jgi:hypothetical protein
MDQPGRMDPSALKVAIAQARAEGKTPFMVSSTAGSTIMGELCCKQLLLWVA